MTTRGQRRLGLTYLFAGAMHFVAPRAYMAAMPRRLPAHRELVYASGVAELLGGAGVLHPRTRVAAGWWLIATLIAIFPANLKMAIEPGRFERIPRWLLYARLPFQAWFVWDVWRLTILGRS